eukprot:scaffold388869_cov47-Prasinocladus_malaysianus.AAC.2
MLLQEHANGNIDTHVAAFEVYSRRGRLLLALQAVKAAHSLGGEADTKAFRLAVKMGGLVKCLPAQG